MEIGMRYWITAGRHIFPASYRESNSAAPECAAFFQHWMQEKLSQPFHKRYPWLSQIRLSDKGAMTEGSNAPAA
jgi:hypothetical protein